MLCILYFQEIFNTSILIYAHAYQALLVRSMLDARYNCLPCYNILRRVIPLLYKVGAPFYDILFSHRHKTCTHRDISGEFDTTFHHMSSSAPLLDKISASQ